MFICECSGNTGVCVGVSIWVHGEIFWTEASGWFGKSVPEMVKEGETLMQIKKNL